MTKEGQSKHTDIKYINYGGLTMAVEIGEKTQQVFGSQDVIYDREEIESKSKPEPIETYERFSNGIEMTATREYEVFRGIPQGETLPTRVVRY